MQALSVYCGFPARSQRGYMGLSSVYLLRAERTLLFDTAGYGERGGLLQQLRSLGTAPEAVKLVSLSHLHFYYAANFDLFPQATMVVHRLEFKHVETAALLHHVGLLRCRRLEVVSGEEELFPSVQLLDLPGHTPGLFGLEVEGLGVLCSDAIKSRFDLQDPPAPPCWNSEAAVRTRERLLSYPRLFPGHDVPLRRRQGRFVLEEDAEFVVYCANG